MRYLLGGVEMAKIYSDASLIEYKGCKIGSYCSIILLSGKKILLHGRSIKREGTINGLEYNASIKGIIFAVENLQIKPEELIAFVDNHSAYKLLLHNEFKVKVKFIGGSRINRITDKDRQLYHLCHLIVKRTTASLLEAVKMQKSKDIKEIEEEKIGFVRTINDLSAFIEREIEPMAIEKIRMQAEYKEKAVKDFKGVLEEIIDEHMKNDSILAVVSNTNNQIQLYLSAREILNSVKTKTIEKVRRRVLSLV
jgi:hypothetical protein